MTYQAFLKGRLKFTEEFRIALGIYSPGLPYQLVYLCVKSRYAKTLLVKARRFAYQNDIKNVGQYLSMDRYIKNKKNPDTLAGILEVFLVHIHWSKIHPTR